MISGRGSDLLSRWLPFGISVGLLSLTMFGCATSSVDAPGRSSSGVSSDLFERQVMVTFPTTSHFLVRRSIQELSVTFELRMVASWTMESLGQQCVVFEVPEIVAKRADAMDRLVQSLSRDHRIELAQRVQRFSTRNTLGAKTATNDGERSSYRRFQHAADLLRLDAAHSLATGRGVRVAVIDTGMDLGHPEYGRRIVEARDFVGRDQDSFTNDLHGTAVAGLIAARHDDGVGIVGVAPEADLVAIKACWPEPAGGRRAVCNSYTLALALDYAVSSEAEVINLSLGGPDDPILRRLVEAGLQRHTVVVAANGGDGADFPAIVPGVLDVRALPRPDEPREETADLETTWLSAPGHEILTTVPGGYDFWNGSSMAAAQVSGVAALLLEHRPDMTPEEVTILLRDSSRDNPGHGVVDACAAVSVVAGRACGQSGN